VRAAPHLRDNCRLKVEVYALVHLELDVFAANLSEASFGRAELVQTWRQFRQNIRATAIRPRRANKACALVSDTYLSVSYNGSRGISDRSSDKPVGCLRRRTSEEKANGDRKKT